MMRPPPLCAHDHIAISYGRSALVVAADYPFLHVFWTMLVFFLWVMWFWRLFTVWGDIFRRDDISGWVALKRKALA
jgi:hypothetical protein